MKEIFLNYTYTHLLSDYLQFKLADLSGKIYVGCLIKLI